MKAKSHGEEKRKAGIWIRVSTEDQARGESPEHHERRARYYAEAKGWDVVEVYHLEGVSGKDVSNHPETTRMLGDIRGKRIHGLIFSKLARLARDTRQLLDFADIFRDAGADLISLEESIDTATPAGRLFYTMIAAMAHWEREEIASRVSASVAIRAKLGKSLGGAAPFGYAWKNKVLVIDTAEAKVRRLMYELFAEHKRKKTVARLLNEAGHRTRNGSKFSDTTVGRLILDPTAKGKQRLNYTKSSGQNKAWEYKPESEWQYVDVEPIVSVDLWNTCANLLGNGERKRQRPAKKAVNLFAGLTYCACGEKMYVPSNSPKYTCQKCRNKIPSDDLEAVYVNELKGFFTSRERISDALAETNTGIAALDADLGKKKTDLAKLQGEIDRVYRLYVEEKLSSDEFGRFFRPLEDKKKGIADEVAKLEADLAARKINTVSAEAVVGEASDLYGRWSGFEREEKRRIIESLTDSLVVGDGEIAVNLKYLPSLEELTKEQRNLMAALPICHRKLSACRPLCSSYPMELKTIGDHIRKRRLDLKLLQKDIGQRMGVCSASVVNWEHGMTPELRYLPGILAFLGYDPRPKPTALAELLVWFREGKGWSQKRLAEQLGVDVTTLARWERGERVPWGPYAAKVAAALSG